MTEKIKLSLYLKFKEDIPQFELSPGYTKIDDNTYSYEVNPTQVFDLSVTVNQLKNGSALIIDKIIMQGTELNHLDSFGVYRTKQGIKKTYGYMDELGTYRFKIRYNALSHNYINFLLNN